MPHEVADLEPVLLMLSKQDRDDVQVVQLISILLTLRSKYEQCFDVLLRISRKSEIVLFRCVSDVLTVKLNQLVLIYLL